MPNFGPSTPLLQQAILTLLQGRQPSPLAPVPTMPMTPPGGVFQMPLGPPPEPAPVAPMPARDESLIEQLTGPRPVAPVAQPVSLLQKVALALQGFGAGTQGQGPQFLANLREERERPQREFRAATEQYEERRRRGVEVAEAKRERQQEQLQRQAEANARRDFELYLSRSNFADEESKIRLRAGFDAALQREVERAASERLEKQQKLKFGEDLAAQIKFYRSNGVPNAAQARRLALNDFADVATQLGYNVPELIQGDDAALAKVAATIDRLNRLSRGGAAAGGGSRIRAAEKAAADFESAKTAVESAIQRGDVRSEKLHRRKLDVAFGRLQQFSDLIESGYGAGGWPYQKPRGQQSQASAPSPAQTQQQMTFDLTQPAQQPQGKTITMTRIRELAAQANPPISEQEAIQRAVAQGFTITQ